MIATKDAVLYALKTGGELSGEEISRKLGVSRAAVNLAVQALRKEGYGVASATNRGYRLTKAPEKLSVGELLPFLGEERAQRVTVTPSVGSTNTVMRELSFAGKAGAGDVLIALAQTAGRGRLGRSFVSPPETGLYLSYCFGDLSNGGEPLPAQLVSQLTAWGAVAVRDAIEEACGVRAGIKWVNDLVVDRKKLCGILTELSLEGESGRVRHAVMGIGINVGQTDGDFAPEIADKATSLRIVRGESVPRAPLAAAVIRRLDALALDFPAKRERYLAAYRAACVNLGEVVRFTRGEKTVEGVARDIDDSFGLAVALPDGSVTTVTAGEVSLRGYYDPA